MFVFNYNRSRDQLFFRRRLGFSGRDWTYLLKGNLRESISKWTRFIMWLPVP